MKKLAQASDYACPVEAAFDVIGSKWKGVILYQLLTRGTLRFGQLRRLLPTRAVEYSLTPLGESVRPWLLGLCDWGAAFQAMQQSSRNEIEARSVC